MQLICRKCSKQYDARKSRADYRGYCSQRCMLAMAKRLGWKREQSVYRILADHIGDVPAKQG